MHASKIQGQWEVILEKMTSKPTPLTAQTGVLYPFRRRKEGTRVKK